jgi:4'-phosphopantetheinyl transferase
LSRTPHNVGIWHIPLDPGSDVLRRCHDLLDEAERDRLARFASPDLARRYTVAHGAARQILGRLLDTEPSGIRYRLGTWGKPELVGHPEVFHNLTHSGDLALLAVSTDESVGVDLERLRPALPARALALRYYPPAEARAVVRQPDSEQPWWYQRFWTRKEACGKASGVPLMAALRFRVHRSVIADPARVGHGAKRCRLSDVPTEPGYLAAVAMLGAAPYTIDLRRWRY